mmetsp:Transcript_6174/g.9482  ORF Transcript_6174/g.9482 Transcript_6174/m.9482 type:complete len:238 (+) Transcript_6174:74-787(+)
MDAIINFNNKAIENYEKGHLISAENFQAAALFELNVLRERLNINTLEEIVDRKKRKFVESKKSIIRWSKPFPWFHVNQDVIMFTRGMFLEHFDPSKTQEESSEFASHLEVVTLTLFYNASMINHLYSYTTKQISQISNGACKGYEIAFSILNRIDEQSPDICIPMKLLKIALLNNIGVLFCNDMCRYRDAAECFEVCRGEMCALVGVFLIEEKLTTTEAQQLSTNIFAVPFAATPAA